MVNNYQPISAMLKSIIDYRGKTPPKSEFGIPCISAANVKNGRIDMSSPSYVSQETYNRWTTRGFPQPGDIIITTEAPVGAVAIFPGDQTYLLTRRVMALQTNSDLLNNRFLFYILQTPEIKNQLFAVARGTTVQRVLKTDITGLTIPLPPLSEQKKIVHILGALDDKIELNQQINTTLEGMAQALFKSWFVDFDPVIDNALAAGNPIPEVFAARAETRRKALADGTANREVAKQFPAAFQFNDELGNIPDGWEIGKISDLFELHRGFDLSAKNRKIGTIPVYSAGGIHGNHNAYKVEAPGIITGRSGVIGNVFLSLTPFWPLNTTLYVREFRKADPYYTLHFLKNIDLKIYNSGSAVPSLNRNFVHSTPTLIPSEKILRIYEGQADHIFKKIKTNGIENENLSNLRDTLFPKLISGEIRIPEAEKLTEEALA